MQNLKPDSSNPSAGLLRSPSPTAIVKSPRCPSLSRKSVNERSSSTSVCSRRTDLDSDGSPVKLKNKFTQPRMNKLTELRLKRLQDAANSDGQSIVSSPRLKKKETIPAMQPTTEVDESGLDSCLGGQSIVDLPKTKAKKETITDSSSSKVPTTCSAATTAKHKETTPSVQKPKTLPVDSGMNSCSTPASSPLATSPATICSPPAPQLKGMINKLADLQSEFMKQAETLREDQPISCKFTSKIQDEQSQLILSKNIPAQSVGDLKTFGRKSCDGTKQSSKKLDNLQSKVELVNSELSKLNCADDKLDASANLQSNDQDRMLIDQLKGAICKLESDVANANKTRDELKKSLEDMRNKNTSIAIELAEKNIRRIEQTHLIDDLRIEIEKLKHTNQVTQKRLEQNILCLDESKEMNGKQIAELKTQLDEALADKQAVESRTEELTKTIALKDQHLTELQKQLTDLEQHKAWQDIQCEQAANHEADLAQINVLKGEFAANQKRLADQAIVEQSLRDQLIQKQKQLSEMELKVNQLEESVIHHRKMNEVRSERIVYLDQEMKQREQENLRKLNEVISQSSDKSAIITQISNELASTNEQFQNLCETLSTKQTKLHSQEHVIRLLEESNARSVKLHTKMGEKNAFLKDEIEHLRRTVNNLVLSKDCTDVDVTDILVE